MTDEREGRLGLGAMISMLAGNDGSVEAWRASEGKEIASLELRAEANGGDGALIFTFTDGSRMQLADEYRSCCESRYLHTDDDLSYHEGAVLMDAEVRDGGDESLDYGVKETAFLVVTTSKGQFTVVAYNEHNGYYGGVGIRASTLSPASGDSP